MARALALLCSTVVLGLAACGDASRDATLTAQPSAGAAAREAGPLACEILQAGLPLPAEVRETSGLARSGRDPSLVWTHNDAGHGPFLFAIGADGRLAGRVRVAGAGAVDWEDIETAPCDGATCLYIGDIGDNDEVRPHITIYRVPEPAAGAAEVAATALHARYPDGARDAEALFAHRSGDFYIITKGRSGEIVLYRWPAPLLAGDTIVLERVRVLFPRPRVRAERVTAASASPNGSWVAVRTYGALHVFATEELLGGAAPRPRTFNLSALREPQGEGVLLDDDGVVRLSSEAGNRRGQPQWSRLRCSLPGSG